MSDRSVVLRLNPRGRSVPLAVAKILFAVLLVGLPFAGARRWVQSGAAGQPVAVAAVTSVVGWAVLLLLGYWALRVLLDGLTDLLARLVQQLRDPDDVPPLTMVIDVHGVGWARADGPDVDVFVPWEHVLGTGFRRHPSGSWWFCVDPDPTLADPVIRSRERAPGTAPGWHPHDDVARTLELAPVEWLEAASTWVDKVAPSGTSRAVRAGYTLVFLFGTPLAINLELCRGVRLRNLDRAVSHWSHGRCRVSAPYRPWWWPPLPRRWDPLGREDELDRRHDARPS